MQTMDLNRETIEGALNALYNAVATYNTDAANLDSCEMNGKPWAILASELEKAADRAYDRIRKSGYPLPRADR